MKTKLALSAFVAAFVLSACGSKTEAPAPAAETPPRRRAGCGRCRICRRDAAAAASSAAEAASAAKP